MTFELGLIAASLLILLAAAGTVIVFSSVFLPVTISHLGRLAPATRASFLLAWATSPLWLGIVILVFILAPPVAHALGLGTDHCHVHDHHTHLCAVHSPLFTGGAPENLILGGVAALIPVWFFGPTLRLHRGRRALRTLLALSKPSTGALPYHIASSQRPFAVTAGLLRPKVILSSRLLEELGPLELKTVLSHELAHQHRRDGLRLVATELFARIHLPATRRLILEQYELSIEQACDEIAAKQTGDRLQVAATILKLVRLVGISPPVPSSVGPSFNGADATRRVEGLLNPPVPLSPWIAASPYVFTGLLPAVGLVTSDWWHHSAETLFGFFLG